jgi:UDP-GlcNAc:undecaprenyl-phosphate GlcNAc-1-phosphate transferase
MSEMSFNLFGYAAAAILTAAFTPVAIRFARAYRIVDAPDARKIHSTPIPRFGGVAVFVVSLTVILSANAFGLLPLFPGLSPLLLGAFLMFAVGLWDDLRGLSARQKLAFQCIAAVHFCMASGCAESISIGTLEIVFPYVLSWGLSVLWLIGLTNAINMTDGLDALASGLGAIVLMFLGVVAMVIGMVPLAFCLFAVSGSLTGFLVFNSNPAKIFLGDSGSLFLGFLLAGASLQVARRGPINLYLIPLTALLVPVFDILLVMLRRYLERRSVFSADRNHFHHRLLDKGYPQRQAVLMIYALTCVGLPAGLLQLFVHPAAAVMLFCVHCAGVTFVFRKVGAFRFREMIAGLRKNAHLNGQMQRERRRYERVELHFRKADTVQQWWKAVCLAAETLGFRGLILSYVCPDGTGGQWVWHNPDPQACQEGMISMTVPVYDPKAKLSHRLRVDVRPGDSFESAGRTLTLFARLIDKYGSIRNDKHEKKLLMAIADGGIAVSETTPFTEDAYETVGV